MATRAVRGRARCPRHARAVRCRAAAALHSARAHARRHRALPNGVRQGRRQRGRADRGPALHAGVARRYKKEGDGRGGAAPARGARHIQAGRGRRPHAPPDARRSVRRERFRRGDDQRAAGGGREGLGGRNHDGAHARSGDGRRRAPARARGRYRRVHSPPVSLQRGGSSGDELPLTTLDPADAGVRVWGLRAGDGRVCGSGARELPVLQLWGCDGGGVVFEFTLQGTSGAARAGNLTLPHGSVETPCFMPVGTQGTVRALSPGDLKAVGAQIVLANTYHLHVRPGEDVVTKLGRLHRFMAWDRPLLTDSGGFQVFSLASFRRVDDDGVEFTSHVDGAKRYLTPERATEIQWTLGADIAMAFDHVAPGAADEATSRDALGRTLRWLERCAKRHSEVSRLEAQSLSNNRLSAQPPDRQTLSPILQGALHPTPP